MHRRLLLAAVVVLVLSLTTATAPVGVAEVPVDSGKLRQAVTVKGIRKHLHAFQSFADQSHGTRVDGTVGFDRSVGYVAANVRAAGYQVTVQRFTFRTGARTVRSANVLAERPGGRADRTVVVGAHLDSVPEGPGINDNGSGSAAILEVAVQLGRLGIQPTNRVRFAWWGAEEFGLVGSEHYLSHLSKPQLNHIALDLNFDMVASPNFVRLVYDGSGTGPAGSAGIERLFNQHFAGQGLETAPTPLEEDDSDYGPFIDRGIPSGGLFSGDEDIKTPRQAVVYGGTAGVAYDRCYHQPCDTIANINNTALDQMSDGIADAALQVAMTSPPTGDTG